MSEPTYEELKVRVAELEKQAGQQKGSLEFRVGEKGGVSVYGLGRFPVTLYYRNGNELAPLGTHGTGAPRSFFSRWRFAVGL